MSKKTTPPAIEMTDVKKSFGTKHVLQNINLKVEKGESLVVIGGSGTGVTVTNKVSFTHSSGVPPSHTT